MNPDNQLATQEPPSVAIMLQTALAQGVTKDNADALGKLMELYERMEDRNAEKQFASDFVALKKAMPPIHAIKPVPNKDGTVRYHFAPLEEIDRILKPIALQYGFTYSFTEEQSNRPGTITKVCIVQHSSGHSARHPYSVRIGSGPPGSTESQSDGAAHSYAKRGALCDAFGIVIERDTDGAGGDDARDLGRPITAKEAADLADWVEATKSDKAKFLKFAEAATFEEIRANRLSELHALLKRAEQKGAK